MRLCGRGAQPDAQGDFILVKFQDDPRRPDGQVLLGVWDSHAVRGLHFRGGPDTTTGRTLSRYLLEISYGDVDIMTYDKPPWSGCNGAQQLCLLL